MIQYLLYNQTDSNKQTAINRQHQTDSIKQTASNRQHQIDSIKQTASNRQHQTDSNQRDKEPRNTRLNHARIIAARHEIKSRIRANLVRSSSLIT